MRTLSTVWNQRHVMWNRLMDRLTLLRAKSRLPMGDPTYTMTMPYQLQIAVTTRCNLMCSYCENPLMAKAGMVSDMDFDKYCRLVDQLAGVRTLSMLGIGEPLLHPRFPDMVKYAASKKFGWHISTTSNGMLLDEKMSDRLRDAGLMEMRISIDGADKGLVEFMRKGADFDRIVRNFRTFKQRTHIPMAINVVMSAVNLDAIRDIVGFAKDLGADQLQVMTLKAWSGVDMGRSNLTLFRNVDSHQIEVFQQINAQAEAAGISVAISYEPFYGNFCADPWNKPYINPDGQLAPCCTWTTNYLDNVFEVGFKKAWNGPRIRALRKMMLAGYPAAYCYTNCRLVREPRHVAVARNVAAQPGMVSVPVSVKEEE